MMVVVMMMSTMMRFTLMLMITMMLMDVMVFLEDAAKGNLRGPDLLFNLFVMQILKHGINIFETRDGAQLLKSNFGNSYCTMLIIGPGANRNLCQKMHFPQICLLSFQLCTM